MHENGGDSPSERMTRLEVKLTYLTTQLDQVNRGLEDRRTDNNNIAESLRAALSGLERLTKSDISDIRTKLAVHQAVGLVFLMGLSAMVGAGAIKIKLEADNVSSVTPQTMHPFLADH